LDAEAIVKAVYEIKIDKLIADVSASSITVAKASSKSDISIEHNVVKSGPAISGKYKIKCVYDNGEYSLTNAINWNTDPFNINRAISEQCLNMRNRILVTSVDSYKSGFQSNTVGTAIYIEFNSYNENPGQFEIISDEDDPL
jgi:hypothetical protein